MADADAGPRRHGGAASGARDRQGRIVRRWAIAAIGCALTFAFRPLAAQTWRTVESSRQLLDSARHHVHVQYGAGRIDIAPTDAPVLYAMTARYDETTAVPLHSYDAAERALTLGVRSESRRLSRGFGDQGKGEMRLSLPRAVPLDLDLDLGATKANLDFGGLNLLSLRLNSGASETRLDFSTPNTSTMRTFEVAVGAASFEARNLANANAATMHVQGGVGAVDLDFGGQWERDITVEVEVALGKLTLHVPRDVGVRVEVQKFLASFEHEGLHKRGDAYFSDNWETAKYRLRVRAQTTFGGIEVDRAN
jgi:hypothetical protein